MPVICWYDVQLIVGAILVPLSVLPPPNVSLNTVVWAEAADRQSSRNAVMQAQDRLSVEVSMGMGVGV